MGQISEISPRGDVSRPYLRVGAWSDGGDSGWAHLGENAIPLLASRQRLPFPRSLPWGRLHALRLLPPDFIFHLGFGTGFLFYVALFRFTYQGLLCWAVIREDPNLLDLYSLICFLLVGRLVWPTWIYCSLYSSHFSSYPRCRSRLQPCVVHL